jgi:hypothetical protein
MQWMPAPGLPRLSRGGSERVALEVIVGLTHAFHSFRVICVIGVFCGHLIFHNEEEGCGPHKAQKGADAMDASAGLAAPFERGLRTGRAQGSSSARLTAFHSFRVICVIGVFCGHLIFDNEEECGPQTVGRVVSAQGVQGDWRRTA